MRILSFVILTLILAGSSILAQSPHEKDLNIDCSKCHSETSWTIDKAKISFNHSETKFSLEGQHQSADCKSCHTTLIFKDAATDCQSCHKDIHQGTVGFDCARCHTPQSWLVKDMNNLSVDDLINKINVKFEITEIKSGEENGIGMATQGK